MPVEIRVPQLGESIVEATIGKWLKKEGDAVSSGENVVELETEKVNLELQAEQAGVLTRIAHRAGDTVRVGDVLAVLDDVGAAPAAKAAVAAPAAAPAASTAPAADAAATPVAKTLAAAQGVDIGQVAGSGRGGRVTQEDVARAVEQRTAPAAAQAPAAAPAPAQAAAPAAQGPAPAMASVDTSGGRPEERRRMSTRRRTIARRLVEAQHTAAMLTTYNEVDMTAVMGLRTKRQEDFTKRNGIRLGFMSFFTKAVVGALKAYPIVNSEIQGDEVVVKKYYDMGMAVATEDGLLVPVIRDADRMTFADIERKVSDFGERSRSNKLTLQDLQGGTFTISNGGVFGSMWSMPILNAPQSGILGLHKIEQRPIVAANEIVIRPMMYLAFTYDHRVIDGREAVLFLVRIKELIEDPETLLLDG